MFVVRDSGPNTKSAKIDGPVFCDLIRMGLNSQIRYRLFYLAKYFPIRCRVYTKSLQ